MDTEQLPHLETFSKAAELSSFTAAARVLGLTQAAVSQRIAALETMLNTALFQRQGGRVLLTEAGRKLHTYAVRILELHREAREQVTGRAVPISGELSLAASSVPGEHHLPRLLSAYHEKYPHVQVRATAADSDAVLRQVEQGQVHLGLVGKKGEGTHFEYRRFATDTLALITPVNHPLAQLERVPLVEFCRQPLVLREVGSGSRWRLEQALQQAGKSLADCRVALELGSNEAIKEAVLRGIGLAVLSDHTAQREAQAGRLRLLNVAELSLQREIYAVWDRRRAMPIPAQHFLGMLATSAGIEAQT